MPPVTPEVCVVGGRVPGVVRGGADDHDLRGIGGEQTAYGLVTGRPEVVELGSRAGRDLGHQQRRVGTDRHDGQ
jgi:hypothetical protein